MKLVDNRNKSTKRFDELKAGEPFYCPKEEWYGIKLDGTTSDGENAVDIVYGELVTMHGDDKVVPLNAQIVIL